MLAIAQAVIAEIGADQIPTSIISATDTSQIQIRNLLQTQARSLRNKLVFPQQKKIATLILQQSQDKYQFPPDYYSATTNSAWDDTTRLRLIGPLSDSRFTNRTRRNVGQNHVAYRVFGPDANTNSFGGQLNVTPTPASSGEELSYEYITKNLFVPPNWIPGAHYSGGVATAYVNLNGNNYFTNTTGNAGSFPVSVGANGIGLDGGVSWQYLTLATFVSNSLYPAGTYLFQGGHLYHATQGGKSGVSGPTGTGTAIVDGTVIWESITLATWTAYANFTSGQFTTNSGNYYKCVNPGGATYISGASAPNWSSSTQTDGALVWAYQATPYETIISDSDMCLFDDDIMQAGFAWRYRKAKELDFDTDFQEYVSLLNKSVSRLKGAFIGRVDRPESRGPRYSLPDGGWSFD